MIWDKILIIFFIIFIYIPIAGLIFNIQDGLENTEKRNMAKFPKFKGDIGGFSDGFLKYYEDNFGFRYTFIRLGANLKIKLFKTYPKNIDIKVLKGKDGWLFYKLGNEIEDFEGRVPFNEQMTNKIIKNQTERETALHPVKFYTLIPPDKTVVYKEYLPNSILQRENPENSRIEMLLKAGAKIIYPKEILLENKDKGRLYFKTDTHWTYLGAYYGYRELMNNVKKDFKNIKPLNLDDFKKADYIRHNPDLSEIVNVGEGNKNKEEDFIYRCNVQKRADLKALVFGDSFYQYLEPYLKCTFKEVKYINSNTIKKDTVSEFQPDIVILEIVQRNLRQLEISDNF